MAGNSEGHPALLHFPPPLHTKSNLALLNRNGAIISRSYDFETRLRPFIRLCWKYVSLHRASVGVAEIVQRLFGICVAEKRPRAVIAHQSELSGRSVPSIKNEN